MLMSSIDLEDSSIKYVYAKYIASTARADKLLTLVQLLPTTLFIRGDFKGHCTPILERTVVVPALMGVVAEEPLSSLFPTFFSSVNEKPNNLQPALQVEDRSLLTVNAADAVVVEGCDSPS